MVLCPRCNHLEHTGMTCMDCGCMYNHDAWIHKKGIEMKKDEAIEILLKYVETDTADHTLQDAVRFLKQEKKENKEDKLPITSKNGEETISVIYSLPKYFEIAVSQRQVITYKVLHDSEDAAISEVQKKVKDRDWNALLQFPPGSPYYSPIPFLDYAIEKVSVKEDVLRPNPFVEGKQQSDT